MRDIALACLLGAWSAIALLAAVKAMTPPAITLPVEQWTCTRVERVHSVMVDPVKRTHGPLQSEERCVVYERKGWR